MWCSILCSRSQEWLQERGSKLNRCLPGSLAGAMLKVLDPPLRSQDSWELMGFMWEVRQKPLHQQADETYKESFKLDWSGERDGVLGNREEPESANMLRPNRERPMKCPRGIRAFYSKKVTQSIAQLKCLYTNACSMVTNTRSLKQLCS